MSVQSARTQIMRKKGLILDPRTKLLLLITMTVFVLGGAGSKSGWTGAILEEMTLLLCVLPLFLLVSVRKYKSALLYTVLYCTVSFCFYFFGNRFSGLPNFLLLATAGIITRFLPGLILGVYVISTTTVSEFIAGMQKLHVSDYIIIPMSVMLRFFPTIKDEFSAINDAMRMRGITLGGRNTSKMIEYRLIPLMVCSAKIGEELSVAALTRGLAGSVKRTNVCDIGFRIQDWLTILFCTAAFACLLLNVMGVK